MLEAETPVETGWMPRPGTATTIEDPPLSVDSRCNINNGDGHGVHAMRSNNNRDALYIVDRYSNEY